MSTLGGSFWQVLDLDALRQVRPEVVLHQLCSLRLCPLSQTSRCESLALLPSSVTGCLMGAELTILPDSMRAASRQQLHRLRFHFTPLENKPVASNGVTPNPSRPGSPHPPGLRMSTLDPIMESRKA